MVIKSKAAQEDTVPEQQGNSDAQNKLVGIGINPDIAANFLSHHPDIRTLSVLYDSNVDAINASVCHDKIDGKGRTLTLAIKDTVYSFTLTISTQPMTLPSHSLAE